MTWFGVFCVKIRLRAYAVALLKHHPKKQRTNVQANQWCGKVTYLGRRNNEPISTKLCMNGAGYNHAHIFCEDRLRGFGVARGRVEFLPFSLTCFVAFKTLWYYRSSVWSKSLKRMVTSNFWRLLRLCSENMPKNRLTCCQIATILSSMLELIIAEHDRERRFFDEKQI